MLALRLDAGLTNRKIKYSNTTRSLEGDPFWLMKSRGGPLLGGCMLMNFRGGPPFEGLYVDEF